MSRLIKACPKCGTSQIHYFSGGKMSPGTDHRFQCKDCGATFDSPDEREARGHGASGGSTLVAKLNAADPDEVSAR